MIKNQSKLVGKTIDESRSKVVDESRSKVVRKSSTYNGYTQSRKKANKIWADKQAQIAIRVKPELKKQLNDHCEKTGESLVKFITRACLNQIVEDTKTE